LIFFWIFGFLLNSVFMGCLLILCKSVDYLFRSPLPSNVAIIPPVTAEMPTAAFSNVTIAAAATLTTLQAKARNCHFLCPTIKREGQSFTGDEKACG
jgi:hypothetical protein